MLNDVMLATPENLTPTNFNRKLISGLSVTLVGSVINSILSTVTWITAALIATPEMVGKCALFVTGIEISSRILSIGLDSAVSLYGAKEEFDIRKQAATDLIFLCWVALCSTLILIVGRVLPDQQIALTTKLMEGGKLFLATAAVNAAALIRLNLCLAQRKFRKAAIISITKNLLFATSFLVLLKYQLTAQSIFYATIIGSLTVLAAHRPPSPITLFKHVDLPALKSIISVSLPLGVYSLFSTASESASKMFLGVQGAVVQAGNLQVSQQLFSLGTGGFSALSRVWSPMHIYQGSRNKSDSAMLTTKFVKLLPSLSAFGCCILKLALMLDFEHRLITGNSRTILDGFSIMCLGFIFLAIHTVMYPTIFSEEKSRRLAATQAISAAIGLCVTAYLTMTFQIQGAFYAVTLSQIIFSWGYIYFYRDSFAMTPMVKQSIRNWSVLVLVLLAFKSLSLNVLELIAWITISIFSYRQLDFKIIRGAIMRS